jgi:protein-S-isoprenylcysteine O-methyltransferase Ste14
MQWSLYALYTTYTLIVLASAIEFVTLRKEPVWWISAFGMVLHVSSVVLRKAAIRTLGRFWSLQVEIRSQHRLVHEGAYRFVRHPIYSAIILEVLSIPLVANAWCTLGFALVTHVPLVLWRMRCEEDALMEKFGEAYRLYQREVGALVPRLKRRSHERVRNSS